MSVFPSDQNTEPLSAAEAADALAQATNSAVSSPAIAKQHCPASGPVWVDLVSEETKLSFEKLGIAELLVPVELQFYVIGLELARPGAIPRPATLAEIRGITDLEWRAAAIVKNNIHALSEEARELIISVADAGIIGALVQARLQPPMVIRKIYPWWYRPYKAPPRDLRAGNLFQAFGIDINGGAQ